MRRLSLCMALLTLLPVSAGSAQTGPAPPAVVVAVDTSRSLRPDELRQTASRLAEVLSRSPGDQPTGLLAFDDTPRWVVPMGATPARVADALLNLEPQGDYTQLHDALVVAAQGLEGGGVILLATDGRDENSATTLEDVARTCEARGVQILPLATGRRLEERALRRLALLSGGTYLGGQPTADVADALATARSAVAQARAEAVAVAVPAAAEPATPQPSVDSGPSQPTSEPAGASPLLSPVAWGLLTLALALGAGALFAVLWNRRTAAPVELPHYCSRCGSEIPAEDAPCPHCEEDRLVERLRDRPITRLEDTAELALSLADLEPEPLADGILEVTRVLTDQNMVTVKASGQAPKTYLLRAETAFAVGRTPNDNTIGLADPALSAHHFKIVPEDGMFFVVDLGSTNGTFVNERRIKARQLRSGDLIRAGQTEVEYRSAPRALS